MTTNFIIRKSIVFSILIFTSCINQSPRVSYDQAVDFCWEALMPNTTSGDRDNWEVKESRRVIGREVVGEFADARFINCPGPLPPENKAIKASSEYWYIKVAPLLAEFTMQAEAISPSTPPPNPQPQISEVIFLVDIFNGQVVARKFNCYLHY